jgi:ABC-type hemin transport system ATPase subunit
VIFHAASPRASRHRSKRLARDITPSALLEIENLIVVLVTHELNLAAQMADRILLLESGRVVLQGPPEEVFQAEELSRVFDTCVAVDRNPSSGRPRITWVTSAFDASNRSVPASHRDSTRE